MNSAWPCLLLIALITQWAKTIHHTGKPNIIFILSDDQGYNDVSWNNRDIISPNLEFLARNGIILDNYYAQQACTPSRAALMTGYYPIHLGRQANIIHHLEPVGVFTNFTFLPEYLNQLGYTSHMVGKWHLGYCNASYTPNQRGFKTFRGFYLGMEGCYEHETFSPFGRGYDFQIDQKVDFSARGTYSTDIFTSEVIRLIHHHSNNSQATPLFVYMALQEAHKPLRVPKKFENMYPKIWSKNRRRFSAKVTAMDAAVGDIVASLKATGIYDNTLIVFASDNGGAVTAGGNNYPLRGSKDTLWEGGYKVPAFIHGPSLLGRSAVVHHGLFHVTDWVPTLVSAAGGQSDRLSHLDGIDQWESLKQGSESRTEMLYNINPHNKVKEGHESAPGAALRIGPMKLIRGDAGRMEGWVTVSHSCRLTSAEIAHRFSRSSSHLYQPLLQPRLFNLTEDPQERRDLARLRPDLVQQMLKRLEEIEATMIPPNEAEESRAGNPGHFGGAFSPGWCQARP